MSIASPPESTIISEPSSPAPLQTIQDIAKHYFAKLSNLDQLQRLTAAAPGFIEIPKLKPSWCDLWSAKNIFDQSLGGQSRIFRLYAYRKRIDQGSEEDHYAARLFYIFLEHEIVEKIASLENNPADKKHLRETNKSLAYRKFTTECGFVNQRHLQNDRAHGRHFVSLLKNAGPGDLVYLGDSVSNL